MKFLIPARVASKRCPDKNWRPFADGWSLFDIKAVQLLAADADPRDVHVSVDCESKRKIVEGYGFRFDLRPEELCAYPGEARLIPELVRRLPGDDDVCMLSVTDPFHRDIAAPLRTWAKARNARDSLMVVRRLGAQVLDERGAPKNFGWFGQPTQEMRQWHTVSMSMLISKRSTVAERGHLIGSNPAMHVDDSFGVDVDTEDDFRAAAALWWAQRASRLP